MSFDFRLGFIFIICFLIKVDKHNKKTREYKGNEPQAQKCLFCLFWFLIACSVAGGVVSPYFCVLLNYL